MGPTTITNSMELEPCFKQPIDPVTSNVDPQTSPDADAVTSALDSDNNQASLESCQTSPFLGN